MVRLGIPGNGVFANNINPYADAEPADLPVRPDAPAELCAALKSMSYTDVGNGVQVAYNQSAHARMWDGGLALTKFCSWWHNSFSVAGKRVMELGAGTGVLGLTLGRLGAQVTMTDRDPLLLDLMKYNITMNGLDERVRACRLDWGDSETYLKENEFDMIVASDVLFYGNGDQILVNALDFHVLAGSRTEVLFCFNNVSPSGGLNFFSILGKMGYNIERLENAEGMPVGGSSEDIDEVYRNSHFVALPLGSFAEGVRKNSIGTVGGSIQIFRITKPHTIWNVKVASSEGLLVRSSRELTSPEIGRLSVGSTIKELELDGVRMRYSKVDGDGPESGWVTISARGVSLLQPGMLLGNDETESEAAKAKAEEAAAELKAEQAAAKAQAEAERRQREASGKKSAHFIQVPDTTTCGKWVQFARIASPNGFGLRTAHGTFMSARDDKKTIVQSAAFGGAWEEFVEVPCSGGFYLWTAHETYVSVNKDGNLVQVPSVRDKRERFLRTDFPKGFFGLQTSLGGHICARKLRSS